MSSQGDTGSRKRQSPMDDEEFNKSMLEQANKLLKPSIPATVNRFAALTVDEPAGKNPGFTIEGQLKKMLQDTSAVPVKAPDVDMEVDKDTKFVDYSTMEVPHPEKDEYLKKPNALSVPCMLKDFDGQEWGYFVDGAVDNPELSLLLRIDSGRMAQPNMKIRLRRFLQTKEKKGPTVPASTQNVEPKTYVESHFYWHPGVSVSEADKPYQLDEAIPSAFTSECEQGLRDKGVIKTTGKSFLDDLSEEVRSRLVLINFTGHHARIESAAADARGTLKNAASPKTCALVDKLFGHSPETQVQAQDSFTGNDLNMMFFFCVPRNLDMDAETWIVEEWNDFLGKDITVGTPPWSVYLDKEGKPDMHLDMPGIHTTGNRYLCRWDDAQKAEIGEWLDKPEPRPPFHYPIPLNFGAFDLTINYPSMTSFTVPQVMTEVREHQWEKGEYLKLSSKDMTFDVVMTYKAKPKLVDSKDNVKMIERSEDQARQEESFYLVAHMPEGMKAKAPKENSCWKVNWTIAYAIDGTPIRTEDKKKWFGYVKPMTTSERFQTGGDFMLVAKKPARGAFVRAAPSFDRIRPQARLPGRIEQVSNTLPSERVIDSILEFADQGKELRPDLNNLRLPIIFGKERFRQVKISLADGVEQDQDLKRASNDLYKSAVNLVRPHLDKAQVAILDDCFCSIQNGVAIVLGGPGCRKTTTLAIAVALLNLLGHKILITAEENLCLDHFTTAMFKERKAMLKLIKKSGGHEAIKIGLNAMKVLRFIPPAYERKAMKQEWTDDDTKAKMFVGGNKSDHNAYKHDPKALDLVRAYSAHELALILLSDASVEAETGQVTREPDEPKKQQLESEMRRLQADLIRIKTDYERTAPIDQTFIYPARASMAHHVQTLINEVGLVKDPWDRLLIDHFIKARERVTNEPSGISMSDKWNNGRRLEEASNEMVAVVIGRMDIIVCTYSNAASDPMREKFRPTVVVHEDSNRASIGTQCAALVYEDIIAHIFIGDPKQMPPLTTADFVNEFKKNARLSGLDILIKNEVAMVHWINSQYRMHPSMLSFPSAAFYDGILTSDLSVFPDNEIRKATREVVKDIYGMDLSTKEKGKGSQYVLVNVPKGVGLQRNGGTSIHNFANAYAIMNMVRALLIKTHDDKYGNAVKSVDPKCISILVWYRGQKELIESIFEEANIYVGQIVTVDSYQGHDNNVILLDQSSTAHSAATMSRILDEKIEYVYQGLSGYVKSGPRLNVALTRAKDFLCVFGNFKTTAIAAQMANRGRDNSGKTIFDWIADAVQRDLMVDDLTTDVSPDVKYLNSTSDKAKK